MKIEIKENEIYVDDVKYVKVENSKKIGDVKQYITNISLEIDDNIARLVSKIDDDISEVWKIEKKDILEAIHFKEQLIKYLENKINELEEKINIFYETYIDKNCTILELKLEIYQEILEKVRSGKYE